MEISLQHRRSRPPCIAAAILLLALTQSGALATAAKSDPAFVPVNVTGVLAADRPAIAAPEPTTKPPLISATIAMVVILQKAGPLARRSYWDEYVLALTCPGPDAVSVESADLIDARGNPVAPGDNPWTLANLQKSSCERTDAHGRTSAGRVAAASLGAGVGGGIGVMASPPALAAAPAHPLAILAVGAVFAPIYAVSAISFNTSGRQRVEAEFNRRRLALPVTIAPGQTVPGSLFFPVTPGPQRLALRCRLGDQTRDLVVPLQSLASLHAKPRGKTAPRQPVGSGPAPSTPAATPAPTESPVRR